MSKVKVKVKYMEPYTPRWEGRANGLAREFCPAIHPCVACGGPVVSGYCCARCGDEQAHQGGKEE